MQFLDRFRRHQSAATPRLSPQTFILWEPCTHSHGEVVPGYAHYLAELGLQVAVLLTPKRLEEGLFDRYGHENINLYRMSQKEIRAFLKSSDLSKIAGLMITTAGKLPVHPDNRLDLESVVPTPPKHLLVVEHDAAPRLLAGRAHPKTVTLRTLDDTLIKDTRPRTINPHHFGTIKEKSVKNKKTVFVMVGAARSKRRNQNLVWDAAADLLASGNNNFEIRLIGKPGRHGIPSSLKEHVIELGRLDYPDMFRELEACDFIMTAFQRDNEDHLFYRTTGTSGSFQLAYGFRKPMITQERFTALSALTAENTITYDDDADMARALKSAIEMPQDHYATMQNAMSQAAKALYDQSLNNLKALLDD